MFFWIVTIYYTLHYLVMSVASIIFSPLLTEVYFGTDAQSTRYFIYVSAAIELLFVVLCVTVLVLRRNASPKTIKLWLVTLAAIASYEIGWTVLSMGSQFTATDLIWPVITLYIFLRGFVSVKKYTIVDATTALPK